MNFNSYINADIKTARTLPLIYSSFNHKSFKHLIKNFKGKKIAFTLAETLITLTIIGVVAAITIPTLLMKYKEQSTVTKLKKAHSVLANAAKMAVAKGGELNCNDDLNRIFDEIKSVKDCYSKSSRWTHKDCTTIGENPGGGEYTVWRYTISPDGIVYGLHTSQVSPFHVSVTIQDYKVDGEELVYGFAVDTAGQVTMEKNKGLDFKCPSSKHADYCTYWTLTTGKIHKDASEWLD